MQAAADADAKAAPRGTAPAGGGDGPLDAANAFFLQSYALLKSRVIDWSRNSILAVLGSTMVLLEAEPEPEGGSAGGGPAPRDGGEEAAGAGPAGTAACSTFARGEGFRVRRTAYGFQPRIYNELKSFCHLSLSLLGVFGARDRAAALSDGGPAAGAAAPVEAAAQSEELRRRTAALLRCMEADPASFETSRIREPEFCGTEEELLPESLWAANVRMLQDILAFLTEPRGGVAPTTEEVSRFVARHEGVYRRNTKVAAFASVRSMDACLRQILAERKMRRREYAAGCAAAAAEHGPPSPAPIWRQRVHSPTLHLVVTGEHMPEEGHLSKQYFLAAKGSKCEGDKVYYATGKYTEDEVVSFVSQHMADAVLGRAVFKGDSERMHRDVLADDAAEAVRDLAREGKLPLYELASDGVGDRNGLPCPGDTSAWRCPFKSDQQTGPALREHFGQTVVMSTVVDF